MSDRITSEQRSKVMSKIRAKSHLEDMVARELFRRGVRYRRNNRRLLGTPDISITKYKIVIFIDSCFWHSCPIHGSRPKSNVEFWNKKLNRNIEKDIEVNSFSISNDWNILRVWEHDIRNDFEGTINMIVNFINNSKLKQ
mgnify:FL=1